MTHAQDRIPVPILVGNWKMNGTKAEALRHVESLADGLMRLDHPVQVVICPPITILNALAEHVDPKLIWIGAQDCHDAACGARTGDVNAEMISDAGARTVILGHSERRIFHGETNAIVNGKVVAAWAAGLTALVCIGESQAEYESGQTSDVVLRQLLESIPGGAVAQNTIVAYEPVWAIGSGIAPSGSALRPIFEKIREHLQDRFADGGEFRLLYGGSVSQGNAPSIMASSAADGLLVGQRSLLADEFLSIVRACVCH